MVRPPIGYIMQRASQKNELLLVDHRGEPADIIMSAKGYIEPIAPPPDSLKEAAEKARDALPR